VGQALGSKRVGGHASTSAAIASTRSARSSRQSTPAASIASATASWRSASSIRAGAWFRHQSARDGRYLGTLANHPGTGVRINYGDPVLFGPKHVISILRGEEALA
jgi:hypothetical protein